MQKRYSLDIIEGLHREEEDSKVKIKESWVALDEEQTSKSEIERAAMVTIKSSIYSIEQSAKRGRFEGHGRRRREE